MPLKHYIDQPTDWEKSGRCMIIRGWCFDEHAPLRAIRLRAGKVVLDGVINLPRPDVKASMAEAPSEHTGFEIRGTLPGGKIEIIIEASTAIGSWTPLFNRTIRIKRQWLPLWLGGGDWQELMFFQMPAHMAYLGRKIKPESFPAIAPNKHRPKISVVTPSYQQVDFLAQTMSSVLEQQGVNFEYVIQDGGSTDGSDRLIQRHADKLHAWSCAPDKGQSDAIATGFTKTTGSPDDVMAWINSDDTYLPGTFQFVSDYFARNPEVDVIYGHRIVINERNDEVARWFLPPHDNAVLKLNDFVPQETLFWRRRVWDQVGGINPTYQFAMDWDLLLRFEASGAKIIRVPYFLACFRIHSAQKTAAQMDSVGRLEIDRLRERANNRRVPSRELETHPLLLRYLRHSSWIQFLWKWGIRAR